ncbi:ABC transporter ATP-binding protein, partial [Patescibacteria group bacterium]|nr:ABC transporter ATP-binding protein [Patescibacteria group bacterium]MBU1604761.1 ABC transporter ATP-binding protein [Nanoarchaeota archaeon]MBU2443241.1 ABC transporter ATP-binding protein [Nanoarchaeota archaeon]
MVNQIEIKDLSKRFGKHQVLDNITLSIPQQKIFGIIGESGSGKTTVLKTIIGFWRADKGHISFEGRDLDKDTKFIRQIVGFATQDNCVYPKLTVKENLEYFGALSNVPRSTLKSNIDKVLNFVELYFAKNELAENLSGGMQRRLDIACALIHNPRILILDEPTEDLDPLLRRDILKLIRKINADQTTVIITSHLLDETDELCDEIAILHQGRLLKVGT